VRRWRTLCQIYWAPLYGFVRSRGHTVHDAQDLTQSFFAYLLEHKVYARADRQKGRFRSFLLASLKNFLATLSTGNGPLSGAVHKFFCRCTKSRHRRQSRFSRLTVA
jgi:hypothetical protein